MSSDASGDKSGASPGAALPGRHGQSADPRSAPSSGVWLRPWGGFPPDGKPIACQKNKAKCCTTEVDLYGMLCRHSRAETELKLGGYLVSCP